MCSSDLYQGLLFVLVMLFVPDGIGGLIAEHSKKVKKGGYKALVLPYLLCLVTGLLLLAGVVFLVESTHILLSDGYIAKTKSSGGAAVPFSFFGQDFNPRSWVTWSIPIGLLLAGAALMPAAMKVTGRAWLHATQSAPAQGETA